MAPYLINNEIIVHQDSLLRKWRDALECSVVYITTIPDILPITVSCGIVIFCKGSLPKNTAATFVLAGFVGMMVKLAPSIILPLGLTCATMELFVKKN